MAHRNEPVLAPVNTNCRHVAGRGRRAHAAAATHGEAGGSAGLSRSIFLKGLCYIYIYIYIYI